MPFILKRLALICAITPLILGGLGTICPVRAQTAPQFDSFKAPLMNLGADFMRSIGGNLRQSDLYLAGAGKLELAEQKSGSILPDGEPLLLHAVVGENGAGGKQDIYTIKHDHRLMLSLNDFVAATGLAIKVNAKDGTSSGWFIRETQTFALDPEKRVVTISGKSMPVAAADIDENGGDVLVSAESLEKWFRISFDYDLSNLDLLIKTAEVFPVEEAYIRSQKLPQQRNTTAGAKLSPLDPEYNYVSVPFIDTDLGFNMYQSPGQERTHNEDWSTIVTGDYGGFNTKAYFSGTDIKPFLDTARITMGKQDPRGTLLGPLQATAYQFGDVNGVSNTLIGNSSLERGMYVTNKPLDQETTKTYTEIRGDSHPGYDVELYRNDNYLDIRHVGTDGRYDFGKVDLNLGDNDFKLLFYGPQGERLEEHKHVSVDPNTVADNTGHYEVALTEKDRLVWERTKSTAPDAGTPHLSASYEYGISGVGTTNFGLSTSDDSGTYRTFLEAGLATNILDTFYNATVGYDTSNASSSTLISARRTIARQSVLFEYSHNSEDFNTSSPTAGSDGKDTFRANINGALPLKLFFLKQFSYSVDSTYATSYSGGTSLANTASITTNYKRLGFTGAIQYTTTTTPPNEATGAPGSDADTASASLGVRGFTFGGSWRLGAQYQILPKKTFTGFDGDFSRAIADDVDMTSSVSYDPIAKLTTGTVGLNWNTSKAVISPRVQYDNLHNLAVNVGVHFGLTADPYLNGVHLTGDYVTDNGGVTARIFEDINGNGIFDDGDKLLKDANIVAVQGQQSATSNEDGIAFIPNLPKNILTDITVDAGSSEAAYGVSLFQGVAIMPHPGGVTKLDFPIVESGELDGKAEYTNDKGQTMPAKGMTISLMAPDGKIHKRTTSESDGYWSISVVEPGIYYLTAATDEANPGYFIPKLLEYKPDGTMLFGTDIKLSGGYNVNFNFKSDNEAPEGANHARVIRPTDIASQKFQLQVGAYHSRLAMTLAWYKMKLYSGKIPGGLALAMPMAGMPQDGNGVMSLVLNPGAITTMGQGAVACQAIGEMHVGDCAVNVITTYRTPAEEKIKPYRGPPVVLAAKPADKDAQKPVAAVAASPNVAPDVIVHPSRGQAETTATISPTLAADLADYVAANPAMNRAALREKTVLLNLGSYNSRALMAVIWYKVKTRYTAMIGDATLLVRPTDSNASSQTGKYTLRVSLPSFNVEDANNRCRLLTAQGQFCAVEVLPSGLQASR